MKIGKTNRNLFRKNTIWFDPLINQFYKIIKVRKNVIYLKFYDSDDIISIDIEDCYRDIFIKKMSSLEKELM